MRSDGDAQAAKLVTEALAQSGKGAIELRKVETAVEIANLLSKNRNVTYIPSGQGLLLNVDSGKAVMQQQQQP